MDLTQIEKMILEILSEEEPPARVGQTDVAAGARPGDGPGMQTRKGTDEETGLKITDLEHLEKYVEQNDDFIEMTLKIGKILNGPDINNLVSTLKHKGALEDPENRKERDDLITFFNQLEDLAKQAGLINEEEASLAAQKVMKEMESWKKDVANAIPKMRQMLQRKNPHLVFVGGFAPFRIIKNALLGVSKLYMDINQALKRLKKAAKSDPAKKDTEGGTDSDGDGIPDEKEVEAGTDPKDPKDPTTTTDSPEDIGPAKPETLDVAPTAEEKLKAAFEDFRDKFYCDIPEGANRREETEALEKCRERGVAVTQNEQHAYIRALIDALEPIVNTEEKEAFRGRVTEAKAVNVKSYKQSVFNFYRKAQSIISLMEKAQDNAENRTGKLHLKRAIARVKDLVKNSGIIYDDLRDLMNQVLKLRSDSEETVTEDLLDEKKSSAEKVEKVYNMVREIVQAAIEKIAAGTPGAIRDDLPKLKKALKKLKKIEKLFPKGKLGGKKSTSPDKIADDYKEALEILKEPVNDFYKLKNKISDRGTVDQIASSIREFVKTLTKMFKLEMPPEFKKPVEDVDDTETDDAGEETTTGKPAAPDESLEKARSKYGKVRFIKDMSDDDRESFLKFMALMMRAGILSEGFISKLLGRHINFKEMFGSNDVSSRIEDAIKKLDRADRKRVVAILKQKEQVEAFANLIRSKVDKKSAGNIGQIKAMFTRGRASYKKISKKFPEITGDMYNAVIMFHVLATADKKLKENNPKSLAKTFGRKTVKFQSKFGQVYSQDRIVDTLALMKRSMSPTYELLIDFFENKPKELNYVLKSIAIGTKGKRIEFDPKNWRKLSSVDFVSGSGGEDTEDPADTGDEESGELKGGKSAVKQIGAWLKSRSDRTNPENLKKIATWMNANKDQLKYVKEDKKFKINTVEFADFDDKLKINYGLAGKRIAFLLDRSGIAKEFAKRIHWNGKPLVSWFGRLRMEEELAEMLIPIIQQEMRVMNG